MLYENAFEQFVVELNYLRNNVAVFLVAHNDSHNIISIVIIAKTV